MKLKILCSFSLFVAVILTSACSSNGINKKSDMQVNYSGKENILYIYEDGKMKFRSRYLNKEDVVIYEDGRGGEKAAVKVRVPRYPDFYRDSINVVRVDNEIEKSASQN